MTTVLLTPEYIAHDHAVITGCHPNELIIDPAYRKVYIPPHRRFAIGISGAISPDKIDNDKAYGVIEKFLHKIIKVDPTQSEIDAYWFKHMFGARLEWFSLDAITKKLNEDYPLKKD